MFGSHLSIAGGMINALLEAEELGLETVQVFTKNQQQWRVKPLEDSAVDAWLTELHRLGWEDRTVSHASYLINLASPDDELWNKSIDLMTTEIERCERLSIPFLVFHPGAYTTSTPKRGIARIARAHKEIFKRTRGYRTISCLEDTVGSGSNLGRTFEELATLRALMIERGADESRVGFCFDTCHAHAGGYDMSSRTSADGVLDEFDAVCGLENLRVVHMNDSVKPLGSRRDRHAHIGSGTIGRPLAPDGRPRRQALKDSGFAAMVNRAELAGVPMILETPKGLDERGRPHDRSNLGRLKRLRSERPNGSSGRVLREPATLRGR